MSNKDCKFCQRVGLPILPVRFAWTDSDLTDIPAAMAKTPGFTPKTGKLVIRTLRTGYVFILDEQDMGWRGYQVTHNGLLKEFAIQIKPTAPAEFSCSQAGHNIPASLISVPNASKARKVWIAYSPTYWTENTRSLYKKDLALRTKRMTCVTVGSVDTKTSFAVDQKGASILSHLAEYRGSLGYFNHSLTAPNNRLTQAEAVAKRMELINPGKGLVVALHDSLGITADINACRNAIIDEMAELAAKNQYQNTVGDIILGLEQQFKTQGDPKEWERYKKHIDYSKVTKDKENYDKQLKPKDAKVMALGETWAASTTALGDPKTGKGSLYAISFQDFDPLNAESGLEMERNKAACIYGSGITGKEQEIWDHWLLAKPDDKDFSLWGAITAANKSVWKYLTLEKNSNLVDLFKNSKGMREEFEQWRHKRAAQDATGLIGFAIASQLPRVIKKYPTQAPEILHRIQLVIMVRQDILLTRTSMQVSTTWVIEKLYEAAWGEAKTQLTKEVTEARRLKLISALDGAFVGAQYTKATKLKLELLLPDSVLKEMSRSGTAALPGKATTLALPYDVMPNHFTGLKNYIKQLDGKLVGLGLLLQVYNLTTTMQTFTDVTKGDTDFADARLGMTSGILGISAATLEIAAGAMKGRITKILTQTALQGATKAWVFTTVAGGFLGFCAAFVEGIQTWIKGSQKNAEGDTDAGRLYHFSAGFIILSGAAGFAGTLVTAAAALSAAGATGAIAGAIITAGSALAVIPVWGWILAGLVFLGGGLVLLYKAATAEDTPLEVWLSRCHYGTNTKRGHYSNFTEEMSELNGALYGLQISLSWHDQWGKDEVELQIVMPGFTEKSAYEYKLTLSDGKTRKTVVFAKDLVYKPVQAEFRAAPSKGSFVPLDEVMEINKPSSLHLENGTATLSASVKVNEDWFNCAELFIRYYPNLVERPELAMPAPGGRSYLQVD